MRASTRTEVSGRDLQEMEGQSQDLDAEMRSKFKLWRLAQQFYVEGIGHNEVFSRFVELLPRHNHQGNCDFFRLIKDERGRYLLGVHHLTWPQLSLEPKTFIEKKILEGGKDFCLFNDAYHISDFRDCNAVLQVSNSFYSLLDAVDDPEQQKLMRDEFQEFLKGYTPAPLQHEQAAGDEHGDLFGPMGITGDLPLNIHQQRMMPLSMSNVSDYVGNFDDPVLQAPVRTWGVEQVCHWLAIQPILREFGEELPQRFAKEQINGVALLAIDDHQLSHMGLTVGLQNNLRYLVEQARQRDARHNSPPRSAPGMLPPFPMPMSSLNSVPPPVSPPSGQSVPSSLSLMVDGAGHSFLGKRQERPVAKKLLEAYGELDVAAFNARSVFQIVEPVLPEDGTRIAVVRKTNKKGNVAREKLTGMLGQVIILQAKEEFSDAVSQVNVELVVPGINAAGSVRLRRWEQRQGVVRVVIRQVAVPAKDDTGAVIMNNSGEPKKKRARRETQNANLVFHLWTVNELKHTVVLPLVMYHNNTNSVGPNTLYVQPNALRYSNSTKLVSPSRILLRGFHMNEQVASWDAVPVNQNLPTVELPIVMVTQLKRNKIRRPEMAVEPFQLNWDDQMPAGVPKDAILVDNAPHFDHQTWTHVLDVSHLASRSGGRLASSYQLIPKPATDDLRWLPRACWNRHMEIEISD